MYGYGYSYNASANIGSLLMLPRCLYTMDGVDELINIGDVAAFELDTFTITARAKRIGLGTRQAIYANQQQIASASDACGCFLEFSADNKISIFFYIAGAYESFATTLAYASTSSEYAIAVKKTGTAITLYVDGVIAGTGTTTSATIDYTTTSSKKTAIAAWWHHTSGYQSFLSSTVRDVRFYNVALSDADVNLVKNWSYAPSGMIANWIGENATDTFSTNWTVVDSVSANNGTSVNMEEGDRTC